MTPTTLRVYPLGSHHSQYSSRTGEDVFKGGNSQTILTDQGTNLTSQIMRELCTLLKVKTLQTAVYHPQMGGLV